MSTPTPTQLEANHAAEPRKAGQSRAAIATFFVLAVVVLIGDLWLKRWSFDHVAGVPVIVNPENARDPHLIPPHEGIDLIHNILKLKLTLNHGAVFGIGQGARFLFIAITAIAVIVVITMFWKSEARQRGLHIGLALVLSGAVGNVYDRVLCGAVRDMLYLFPGVKLPFGWTWPGGLDELYPWIFNIADVALVIGVGMILLTLMFAPRRN